VGQGHPKTEFTRVLDIEKQTFLGSGLFKGLVTVSQVRVILRRSSLGSRSFYERVHLGAKLAQVSVRLSFSCELWLNRGAECMYTME
jgi:hypothetical protein